MGTNIIKVLRVQKRAIQTMLGLKERVSVNSRYFNNLKIMTVISLYIILYKCILEIYDDKEQWTKDKTISATKTK